METVGAYEAKTHFSKLLARVAKGESITIEKHGVPVAVLRPANTIESKPSSEVIEELLKLGKKYSLNGLTIRELIEDGRA